MPFEKVLVVSRASPFFKSGSGEVAKQFLNFFNNNEIAFLCEKNVQVTPKSNQVHYINLYPINTKRGKRFFRWQRWFFLPTLVNRIIALVKDENCKSIMCFYPDEIYLIASSIAAEKLGIPLYPYFHNLYYENKHGLSAIIARFVQKRIFKQAPWVYLISKGLLYEMSPKYPNIDFRTLTHAALISETEFNKNSTLLNNVIKLTFLGHINNSNFDALSFLLNIFDEREDIIVQLITSTSKHILEKNKLIKSNTIIQSNISDATLKRLLNKSDLLLLPHGFNGPLSNAEYRSAFPTKTIQYLLSGTPILALLPYDSYLNEFLSSNQCAFCVNNKNKQEIFSVLEKIKKNPNSTLKISNNAEKIVRDFSQVKVLKKLKMEILT